MKKVLFLLASLVICSLLIMGCSSPSASTTATITTPSTAITTSGAATSTTPAATTETKKYGGVFKFADSRAPTTSFGWFAEGGNIQGLWTYPVCESLLRVSFDGTVTPLLAESYDISTDLKSATFHIRKGIKFHDGTTFDGAAAKWNLDQYIAAKMSFAQTPTTVDLVDDYTIRFNITQYGNAFLNNLANCPMVSPTAFNAKGKEGLRWSPVGTGPFKFVSFTRDVSIKYTKFEDYWQKGKPYVDSMDMVFIVDKMTQTAAFQAQEIDALWGDLGKIQYDLQQAGFEIVANNSGIVCLSGDSANKDSPFANLKVRQAVDYAIDRDALAKSRGYGFQVPVFQYAYPNTPYYIKDLETRPYNPEKAKQLLAEAGYPNGFKTTITCDTSALDKDAMVAVQGYLSKVGITADLGWGDPAVYLKARTGGWNGLLAGVAGIDANMHNAFQRSFLQSAANYKSMLKTDEFEALYNTSLSTRAIETAQVQGLIKYFFDNAQMIPAGIPIRALMIRAITLRLRVIGIRLPISLITG